MKNFDFDNETSKNTFLHPYIYYMASERLQGEKQLHFKNYLLEKVRLAGTVFEILFTSAIICI